MRNDDIQSRQQFFGSLQEAQEAARQAELATDGKSFPCIFFTQGDRNLICTSFPFGYLANQNLVNSDPVYKSSDLVGNPRESNNRPLEADHAKAIRTYLRENSEKYILPPITLNLTEEPAICSYEGQATIKAGWVIIDATTRFKVTDGQHRIAAIAGIPNSREEEYSIPIFDLDRRFLRHSVSVQIVIESDTIQSHQDFADAAKTKPIQASLLAVYDSRQPINLVLGKVVQDSSLFRGRVDEVSKGLSKNSRYIFTLNQVRVFLKQFLWGKKGQSEISVKKFSETELSDNKKREEQAARVLRVLNLVTKSMAPWSNIANSKPENARGSEILDLREKYLNLTGTGLALIGRIAHEVLAEKESNWDNLFKKLGSEIDWRREGKIWRESGLVEHDGDSFKITGGRDIVEKTVKMILEELGIKKVKDSSGTSLLVA